MDKARFIGVGKLAHACAIMLAKVLDIAGYVLRAKLFVFLHTVKYSIR
jgi:hypothetical protein